MRVNNNIYTDNLILRYSRTLQAINTNVSKRFDYILAEANKREENAGQDTIITDAAQRFLHAEETSGRDKLIAGTAQRVSQAENISGRDELIADAAQRASQAMNISGRYDTVLSAYTRKGGKSCV